MMKTYDQILESLHKIQAHIITVTPNPVIDKSFLIKNFQIGETYVADESQLLAAGKGVNVSRALAFLGIKSIATGLLPRHGFNLYTALLQKDIFSFDFVETDGFVRTNITIMSDSSEKETHIREKGSVIAPSVLSQMKDKLRSLARTAKGAVVFSGSLPSGLPPNTYKNLIQDVSKIPLQVCFDASETPFKIGINAKPWLIKPNLKEVQDALGFLPREPNSMFRALHKFHKMDITHVFISMGKNGIIYSNGNTAIRSWVEVEHPINSVGSGDATLAGGLAGILGGLPPEVTGRLACTLGAANTLVSGACLINLEHARSLWLRVKQEHLKP